MSILYLKAFHVIAVVCLFSGLFYMGRLFVYYAEAERKEDPDKSILKDQYALMMKRLWFGITMPSFFATLFFGLWLIGETGAFRQGWFHVKMLFIVALVFYVIQCVRVRKKLLAGALSWSPFKLRLFNEVPALLLVGTVFVVYLKDFFNGLWGVLILGILGLAIFVALFLKKNS